MTKLLPHHRYHIPNGLAIVAALLLLLSSVVGFKVDTDTYSAGRETMPSTIVDSADNDAVNDISKRRSRSLNLGLLLFRRG